MNNQVQGLVDGLEQYIAELEFRERLGSEGKRVVDEFSWEKMIDAYERVLVEESQATR